jgi:hypothetical protein
MRYIKDIAHPQVKISLYSWNSKYIVKIEAGPYEQTYKVAEYDVPSPDAIDNLLTASFLEKVIARFQDMDQDWGEAVEG